MASFTVIISNLNQSGRDASVGITTRYRLDGPGIGSLPIPVARCLERRSVGARLLGLRVRIPPGAWMLVLCVVSTDKAKCRTIKKQEQVRMKNKLSTREKKKSRWRRDFPHRPRLDPGAQPASCTMGTRS
jgi:hypothetical protein